MKNNINPPPLMSQQINPPPHHNNPSTNRHNPPSHNKLNGPGPGGSPASRFHGPDSNFSGNNSGNFSGNNGGNFTGNNGGNFGQNRPASGEPRSAFVPPVPRANGSQATRPPPQSSAPAAAAGIKRDKEVSFMQSLRLVGWFTIFRSVANDNHVLWFLSKISRFPRCCTLSFLCMWKIAKILIC